MSLAAYSLFFKWVSVLPLFRLPMHRAAAQERIVFHLLQTVWGVGALFVAGGNVTGDGFAFRTGFRAFEDNEVACHNWIGVLIRGQGVSKGWSGCDGQEHWGSFVPKAASLFFGVDGGFFFFAFSRFFVRQAEE